MDSQRALVRALATTMISLVSAAALGGCALPGGPAGPGKAAHPARQTLRQAWLDLRDQDAPQGLERFVHDQDRAQELERLVRDHQAALDSLVAAGGLEAAVAVQVQLAFEEAAQHVERSLSLCYIAFPAEYFPRQDLLQQASLLEEVAGDLDPAVVEKARLAIARDLAVLQAIAAGKPPGDIAALYTAGIGAEPDLVAAARTLADLLLR